ncbi:MAG: NAD(P)-dependent oxidoreductase [Bacteroidetes bacterium]|nr:NAD(P)-dependent oxidoreductase [Bacteroidota bacterium]
MKRVLITGASGFIGSHLIDQALKLGWETIAVLRKTSSREWIPSENVHVELLDLEDPAALSLQMNALIEKYGRINYVIHNAGITHAKRKEAFVRVNVETTRNLAGILAAQQQPPDRFVLISSLAAMGPGDPSTYQPIQVDFRPQPVSAYGRSKLMAEQYLESLGAFPVTIIRPTAVYGPRDRDFLQFFRMIAGGFEPALGWHRQMISMIHVEDLAASVLHLADKGRNTIYLASDGQFYDKMVLGAIIRKALGRTTFRISFPLTPLKAAVGINEFIQRPFGRMPFLNLDKLKEISSANWLCDSSELWNDSGQKPTYLLEEGLIHTAEWYRKMGWL